MGGLDNPPEVYLYLVMEGDYYQREKMISREISSCLQVSNQELAVNAPESKMSTLPLLIFRESGLPL